MHVGIEVVTEGSPLGMGSAEGESLRKKVRWSPDVLAQLYGFRMLQPPGCPKRCTAGFPKAEPNDSSKLRSNVTFPRRIFG